MIRSFAPIRFDAAYRKPGMIYDARALSGAVLCVMLGLGFWWLIWVLA